jgi:plastocyanin
MRFAIALALFLAVACAPGQGAGPFAADSEAERAKICKKAEARYLELFGKPSGEEPVAVVKLYKYTFCPTALKVKRGAVVRWVNVDKRTSHSVWFKEQGKPESDRLFSGEQVEMKMDFPPGDQGYICGPHGEQEDMRARIIVSE